MQADPILFYSPGACSLGCIVALEWVRTPYRLCRVEREVRRTPAFGRINPKHAVPAMTVDGRVLTENSAVLARIGRGHDDLLPREGDPARDEVNEWLSYLGTSFHPAFYPFFAPQRYTVDSQAEPSVKAASKQLVQKELAFVEERLARGPYLMGARRTVLDPYLYAMSRWARGLVDLPRDFPRVAAHQAELEKDDAVRFALAIEKSGEAESPTGAYRGTVALDSV